MPKKTRVDYQSIDKFRARADKNWQSFISKYLYINTKQGERVLLQPTASQQRIIDIRQLYRKEQKPCWLLVLKGRQRGVSTITEGIVFSETYNGENTNALVMTHLARVTSELLAKAKLFYKCLPPEIQMPLAKSNELEIGWEHNDSKIELATAGTIDIAHGRTLRKVHLSEISRYKDLIGLLGGLLQAVPDKGDALVIAESTAKGADNNMYELWQEAEEGKSLWQPLFLKWQDDEDARVIFRSDLEREATLSKMFAEFPSLKDRMNHFFDPKLFAGSTEPAERMAWYYNNLVNKCKRDEALCRQEYPMDAKEAFLASGDPFFPTVVTEDYALMCKDGETYDPRIPFNSMRNLTKAAVNRAKDTYFEIWEPPVQGVRYLVVCDSAEGIPGRDPCSLFVFDMARLDIVAELHGVIEPKPFKDMAIMVAKLYNGAIIAAEAHGPGAALCAFLKESNYQPLYYKHKLVNNRWTMTADLGWDTNPATRPMLLSEALSLYRSRHQQPDKGLGFIPSKALIDEIRFFIVASMTNKPEAKAGKHDDRVMAWMIGLMCCLQYMGMGNTGVTTIRNSNIIRPGDPDSDDIFAMLKNEQWTGQNFDDFYGRR